MRTYTLGIIAGSGPEAGIDLWAKVLRHTQSLLGPRFRGDLDAPRVVVVSEPRLGLSMDLRENEAGTWEAMAQTVRQIAPQVDAFAIACNTLNWFAPQIDALLDTLPGVGRLVSFQQVLGDEIRRRGAASVGLLGAAPVTALDDYSAYTALTALCEMEVPRAPAALQELIHDVKRLGGAEASLPPRLAEIIKDLHAETVLLACTELPLIAQPVPGKTLIDVTDSVAATLAALALTERND